MELIRLCHERGRVIDSEYEPEHLVARAELDEATLARLRDFVVSG